MKEVVCNHWTKVEGVDYVCKICGHVWGRGDVPPRVVIGWVE